MFRGEFRCLILFFVEAANGGSRRGIKSYKFGHGGTDNGPCIVIQADVYLFKRGRLTARRAFALPGMQI
jgi:hypothetical protein